MTVKVSAAAILKEVAEKEASLPTVNVNDRLLEQEQDLGNLLGWDEIKSIVNSQQISKIPIEKNI